jgi:hypothetical protein
MIYEKLLADFRRLIYRSHRPYYHTMRGMAVVDRSRLNERCARYTNVYVWT